MNSHAAPTLPNATAIFAGGCFWCMEPPFDAADGVIATDAGYTGGKSQNPTYEEIGTGKSGHFEAIRITYNPSKISYKKLLEIFWQNIDPTDAGGQFADRGSQYHTAIFVANAEERALAEASRAEIAKKFAPMNIATQILEAKPFFVAEDYHQDYYQKNPLHYTRYKIGSGRAGGLKEMWGSE